MNISIIVDNWTVREYTSQYVPSVGDYINLKRVHWDKFKVVAVIWCVGRDNDLSVELHCQQVHG